MAGIRYKGQIFSGAASFGSADEVSVNDGSGQVTDTQTIISRILGDFAEIESSATASKAYAVGDYLVLNGYFYRVTASIAVDEELIEGTNIEKTTVASEASDLTHPAWGNITDKPSTFTPSSHTHTWGNITGKPSTFTPSSHTHTWGNITGKPSTKWTLLGGFASTSFTSTYKNTTLSASMSGYGLIRMNTSYFASGIPDYGGITTSYEQIKAATSDPLVVNKFDGQYRFHIKYVNDTTLAISVAGTTGANNCLSIHGIM